MSTINETNQQYYAGAQGFLVENAAGQDTFTFGFDTDLVFGSWNPTETNYALNNFKLYHSVNGLTYTEITGGPYAPYTVTGNTVQLAASVPQNEVVVCQLKRLDGGDSVSYTHLTLPTILLV